MVTDLNCCCVSNERWWHLKSLWWDIADCSLHIVRNPFDKIATVLVLYGQHLFVDFFHRHSASENCSHRQVTSVAWIASGHHIFRIKHLLCQFCIGGMQGILIFWSKYKKNGFYIPGTDIALYCWQPRDVSGAKPGIKKCNRGNGTMFTASLRKSAFNWPGNRRHVVTPDIVSDTKWLRSP